MPVMGGLRATVEIRKFPEYKDLPIIAITADAMVGVQEKCLEVGMLDFITKPINPGQMLETIEKWIPDRTSALPIVQPEKAKHELVLIPALDGIDVQDGLGRLGGNGRLYFDLLIKFANDHERFIADLENKIRAGAQRDGRRLIHTLKGTSGNLGMIHLHEECKKAEEHLQNEKVDTFLDGLRPLESELNRIMDSLRRNLVKDSSFIETSALSEVKPKLSQLERLLKDNDPEAVNLLKQIGMIQGYEKQLEQLEKDLSNFDFEEALEIVVEINSGINNIN